MFRLLFFPLRLVRLGIRVAGVRNSLLLLIGVGVGLLIAPTTGRDLRARLASRLAARLAARRTARSDASEPLGSGAEARATVGV